MLLWVAILLTFLKQIISVKRIFVINLLKLCALKSNGMSLFFLYLINSNQWTRNSCTLMTYIRFVSKKFKKFTEKYSWGWMSIFSKAGNLYPDILKGANFENTSWELILHNLFRVNEASSFLLAIHAMCWFSGIMCLSC